MDVGNATSLAFFCFLFFSSSSRSHFQDFSFLPQKIPLVICVEHSNTYSPLFPFHCFFFLKCRLENRGCSTSPQLLLVLSVALLYQPSFSFFLWKQGVEYQQRYRRNTRTCKLPAMKELQFFLCFSCMWVLIFIAKTVMETRSRLKQRKKTPFSLQERPDVHSVLCITI